LHEAKAEGFPSTRIEESQSKLAESAQVLSVVGNLVGVMFVAFLFGDLTNILCNLDPAANEFKRTVDNLNRRGRRAFLDARRGPRG